jgi:hypothetical protein
MAADYRLCDKCGAKTFYDANLFYEEDIRWDGRKVTLEESVKYAGIPEKGRILGYLGDWAVLCQDCAKTHKCAIVPNEQLL